MKLYHKSRESQHLFYYNDDNEIKHIEEVQEITKIQKRHFRKGEFFMQSFLLEKLILEKKYTIIELKVLFTLKNMLDFNNRIKGFRQKDIAQKLNSSQPNISRAIKKLEKDKIIYKDGLDFYFNDKFIKFASSNKITADKNKRKEI